MQLDLKNYTAKQYAVILLHEDLGYSCRQISEMIGISNNGVRYILNKVRR